MGAKNTGRLTPISLHPIPPEDALRIAMESGPMPDPDKPKAKRPAKKKRKPQKPR